MRLRCRRGGQGEAEGGDAEGVLAARFPERRRALVFRMPGLKRPEGTRRRRLERILKPLTRAY